MGQGQRLRGEQGEVEVASLRQASDHCDRPLKAPVEQLGGERVLLRLHVHARGGRQHLLGRHHWQLVPSLRHRRWHALGQDRGGDGAGARSHPLALGHDLVSGHRGGEPRCGLQSGAVHRAHPHLAQLQLVQLDRTLLVFPIPRRSPCCSCWSW